MNYKQFIFGDIAFYITINISKNMLGCIEDAEKMTGNKDQRNVLAHLHFVTDEEVYKA